MIKKSFWEQVSESWSKKETIEIPDVLLDSGVEEDFSQSSDDAAQLDEWMKDLLEPDEDLLELTDLWG